MLTRRGRLFLSVVLLINKCCLFARSFRELTGGKLIEGSSICRRLPRGDAGFAAGGAVAASRVAGSLGLFLLFDQAGVVFVQDFPGLAVSGKAGRRPVNLQVVNKRSETSTRSGWCLESIRGYRCGVVKDTLCGRCECLADYG